MARLAERSETPAACSDEVLAFELFEKQRWGRDPACLHCGAGNVYQMKDGGTERRNYRYLWRCRDCNRQYTVRIGTIYEESRIPLRHWCYVFWRASTAAHGVTAAEIGR